MNNIRNIWFGTDVDLSNLESKILQGNMEILDALKLNYAHASYQQMMNQLKDNLGKDILQINAKADIKVWRHVKEVTNVEKRLDINDDFLALLLK